MSKQPLNNGSLRRLRFVTGIVLMVLLALTLIADIVAGVGVIRPDYHVEPVILGTLLGGLLLVIGIEIGSRWPWGGGGGDSGNGEQRG